MELLASILIILFRIVVNVGFVFVITLLAGFDFLAATPFEKTVLYCVVAILVEIGVRADK